MLSNKTSSCLNWAHRGASGHALENTLLAFQKAVEMGADGLECDIRETADNQMVVFHDATLQRMTHRKEAIEHLSLDQIEQIPLGQNASDTPLHIPRLAHLFEAIAPPFLLNLEIKKATPQQLLNCIYRYRAQNRVLLSSFDSQPLLQIRALDSDIAIGYLVDRKIDAAVLQEARMMRAQSLHLATKHVSPTQVRRTQDAGFRVYVYTVNQAASMRRFMAMGVDGLFTNYPDRLRALTTKKGEDPC